MSPPPTPLHVPHCSPPPWPKDLPSARFAANIRQGAAEGCSIAVLGLPDDLGVRLNKGRPGAKGGPQAFRDALARYGVADPGLVVWPGVFDAGDIIPAEGRDENALQETHRRVTEATGALLDAGLLPIAIGGGHDLTFPFVRAVAARFKPLGGAYFDAHLDVRDTVGSGMPFRKLVEQCSVGPLLVDGLDRFVNSREHLAWFIQHGGHLVEEANEDQFERVFAETHHLFVSFDLDVLDASVAPGVSAINPNGFGVHGMGEAVFGLGADPRVRCFDIMELNPDLDRDGQTARVAAHLFLQFLHGYSLRGALTHDGSDELP